MINKYPVFKHECDEKIISLCKKNNYFIKNGLMNNILNVDWSMSTNQQIGFGLEDDSGQLFGFIGMLSHSYNELEIINLSSGLIDSSLRGKGFATEFFKSAFLNGDIILDLSPTKQVYQMLKKHIPGIKDITDYQLWIRPKKCGTSLSISFNEQDILHNQSDVFSNIFKDNSKYNVIFAKISDNNEEAIVAFYTFSRFIIKGFEIIYSSNHLFLEKHFEEIIYLINKKVKAFVCFCDHWLIKERMFDGEISKFGTDKKTYFARIVKLFFSKTKYLKTANRRLILFRNSSTSLPPLDYLYSEMVFYKSSI